MGIWNGGMRANPMASLAPVPTYRPTIADMMLENRIEVAGSARLHNVDKSKRAELEEKYRRLHASRSVEYVAWMEREMGIYTP